MSFNFFSEDWKSTPQNVRYFFFAGAFLIFMSWLIDNWGKKGAPLFWGIDIRNLSFSIGFTIIIIGFGFLILKQIIIFARIIFYKKKYPLKNLGVTFAIRWYGGRLYVFDSCEKKYFHVFPWQTAQDLLLIGPKVFRSRASIEDDKDTEVKIGDNVYKIDKFSDGGFINTT